MSSCVYELVCVWVLSSTSIRTIDLHVIKAINDYSARLGGKERGTGLGLYALSKRMEVLRGACGMSSRPDGRAGSVFGFLCPYRPDLAAESYGKGEGGMGRSTSEHANSDESDSVPKALSRGPSQMPHSETHSWAQRRITRRKASRPPSASFYGELLPLTNRSSPSSKELRNSPLRVLLIDDSQTVVLIVTRLLEEKGHVVEVMKNGFAGKRGLIVILSFCCLFCCFLVVSMLFLSLSSVVLLLFLCLFSVFSLVFFIVTS